MSDLDERSPWYVRLAIGVALSVGAHAVLIGIVELLPDEPVASASERVVVAIIPPPPPKEELAAEPPPEPAKPDEPKPVEPTPPKPIPKDLPKPPPPTVKPPPSDKPPPEHPTDSPPNPNAPANPSTDEPVFGVSMESTSQGGSGPAVRVGNSLSPGAGATSQKEPPKTPPPPGEGSGAPVAAIEVTKMPLPQGRCAGKYTDEAKAAGTEGVVVLDLVVDASGHATNITVVSGLDHGLTEAAVAALKACTFTPGERSGVAVPVKVRGFKIRFVMDQP